MLQKTPSAPTMEWIAGLLFNSPAGWGFAVVESMLFWERESSGKSVSFTGAKMATFSAKHIYFVLGCFESIGLCKALEPSKPRY